MNEKTHKDVATCRHCGKKIFWRNAINEDGEKIRMCFNFMRLKLWMPEHVASNVYVKQISTAMRPHTETCRRRTPAYESTPGTN